jgi:hypothetical protein
MSISLSDEGRQRYSAAQENWTGLTTSLQTALFAGHEMLVRADAGGDFTLSYLGFEQVGLKTIEEAKAAAPTFAKKVLIRLTEMISDDGVLRPA